MSLDYRKTMYRSAPKVLDDKRKTTYGVMCTWKDHFDGATPPVRPLPTEDTPVHLQYTNNTGYDDFHKTYIRFQDQGQQGSFPVHGPPRLRNGGNGGSWRHVTEVLQARGNRSLFVEGSLRVKDNNIIANREVPAGNLIQQSAKQDPYQAPEWKSNKLLACEKEELKAMEGANYMVMR